MANPTTNFGWVMPTSTSLVTNLPADFNTFGQGVDTSMAQLKGGTTGQILSKTSATDMAFTWISNDVGDITAVTAGTGISGGGTSGDVTVTNSMATAMTTKGDLVPATGSGTFSRLAVGTNGQTLVADSSTATGLKWAAPTAAAFVGAEICEDTSAQSIPNNTHTSVTFTAEFIDTDGFHSNTVNTSRITIPAGKAGTYRIFGQVNYNSNGTGNRRASIAKNGTRVRQTINNASATANSFATAEGILVLAVNDYVEVQAYQNSGGALDLDYTLGYCKLQAEFLGA